MRYHIALCAFSLFIAGCGNHASDGINTMNLITPLQHGRIELTPTSAFSNGPYTLSGNISGIKAIPAGYVVRLELSTEGKGTSARLAKLTEPRSSIEYVIYNLSPREYRVGLSAAPDVDKLFAAPPYQGWFGGTAQDPISLPGEAFYIQITDHSLGGMDFGLATP